MGCQSFMEFVFLFGSLTFRVKTFQQLNDLAAVIGFAFILFHLDGIAFDQDAIIQCKQFIFETAGCFAEIHKSIGMDIVTKKIAQR